MGKSLAQMPLALTVILLLIVACDGGQPATREQPASESAAAESRNPSINTPQPGVSDDEPPAGSSPEQVTRPVEAQPGTKPSKVATKAAGSGEWVRIEPGGETRCAHDTSFAFWARQGDRNKALVYFQGGGGCWDAQTCGPGSSYYDATVNAADDPARMGGILDVDDPRNSFSDYSMVYIPSCTGDVQWGDVVREYPRQDEDPISIYHRGFVNGQAALEWLYSNVPDPETILVTGCSAGSVGSIVHVPTVIEHYPQAEVSQLGDSLAFVFHRPLNIQQGYNARANFPAWIDELQRIPVDGLLMGDYYAAIANHYPERRFSQFNTRSDQVQQFYYAAIGGQPDDFSSTLLQTLDHIQQEAPNFHSYTADGVMHCITPRPEFYTLATEGIPFVTWLERLVAGEPLETVACQACNRDAQAE
jgi:hypothetical protein